MRSMCTNSFNAYLTYEVDSIVIPKIREETEVYKDQQLTKGHVSLL